VRPRGGRYLGHAAEQSFGRARTHQHEAVGAHCPRRPAPRRSRPFALGRLDRKSVSAIARAPARPRKARSTGRARKAGFFGVQMVAPRVHQGLRGKSPPAAPVARATGRAGGCLASAGRQFALDCIEPRHHPRSTLPSTGTARAHRTRIAAIAGPPYSGRRPAAPKSSVSLSPESARHAARRRPCAQACRLRGARA